MNRSLVMVSFLLFWSGLCSLLYQVVWFQDFRLILGTSTAATAVVTAIFMAGLGLGSRYLGRAVEKRDNPLAFYALLEIALATAAMATPLLLMGSRWLYLSTGGSLTLGHFFGTLLRILLAVGVLGLPTFLMGGTFPAAARAVASDRDPGRTGLGILYGINTLGAMTGVILTAFYLLEHLGRMYTLFLGVGINLLVGITARLLAGRVGEQPAVDSSPRPVTDSPGLEKPVAASDSPESGNRRLVAGAAFLTGSTFFLMEMVWYRMLSPLLGGSTYSFSLILATVLFGIGLGGVASLFRRPEHPPTWAGFAGLTAVGALFLILPYAMGDRLAVLASLLQPLDGFGFLGRILGWFLVTGVVVLPSAICSGLQFPWLLSLVGRGREGVGEQVGFVYVWNTAGAILGSLVGGFGLLPWLTAPGAWRLGLALVLFLVLASAWQALRREGAWGSVMAALVPAVLAGGLLLSEGPTPAWRHGAIGSGRSALSLLNWNQIRDWMSLRRRETLWEADGIESSVALSDDNGLAFKINGKCDGNSLADAPTQVMLGLISAALHPQPHRAFVVGLGTGCTAGWLADLPGMEEVVCVELEEKVREIARACAPINRNALNHPRLNLVIGDAREVLPSCSGTFDLIVSEPSNPFRAGIASLYTKEFYQSVAGRLRPGGIFSQWVQAYEVDGATLRTIYATLRSVFPYVETWNGSSNDLILTCSFHEPVLSVSGLERKLQTEPLETAAWQSWRVNDVPGFLSHYLANPALANALADRARGFGEPLCTDDRMVIEYGLFRTLGQSDLRPVVNLRRASQAMGADRPKLADGTIDWAELNDQRLLFLSSRDEQWTGDLPQDPAFARRLAAHDAFGNGEFETLLRHWSGQERKPSHPLEFAVLGEAFAYFGNEAALPMIAPIRDLMPGEAALIEARYWKSVGSPTRALDFLEQAFAHFRKEPFPVEVMLKRGLELAMVIGIQEPALAPRVMDLLREPLLLSVLNGLRKVVRAEVAMAANPPQAPEAFHALEPHVPWDGKLLTGRLRCYQERKDPLAAKAEADLAEFTRYASTSPRQTLLGE